ncbi:MAG: DinB family protein [Armatimonadetes bacterium]|nr:DinB family protein [Armatimonadota bacterium]
MDVREVLKYQMETCAKQVDAAFDSLPDGLWDRKTSEGCMTPGETIHHLAEAYAAARKHMSGEDHEWGSYKLEGSDPSELLQAMRTERQLAVEAILSGDPEKAPEAATQYLMLHDAYHVGQMCALRVREEPTWDAYSIY